MKHVPVIGLISVLLVNSPVFAAEQHGLGMNHDAMPGMKQDSGETMMLNDGIAIKIDKKNGSVMLQHGTIPSVKMPPMTMSYRVKDALQLRSLHDGDKVRFMLEKQDSDYLITHIELVKG